MHNLCCYGMKLRWESLANVTLTTSKALSVDEGHRCRSLRVAEGGGPIIRVLVGYHACSVRLLVKSWKAERIIRRILALWVLLFATWSIGVAVSVLLSPREWEVRVLRIWVLHSRAGKLDFEL